MKKFLFNCGLGLSFVLAGTSTTFAAIPPAPINQESPVAWSKVVSDPFDGSIVYDKNYGDSFAYVSSWAKTGIRFTYTKYWREVVGYRTVWKTRRVEVDGKHVEERYREEEPMYESRSRSDSPDLIRIAINGQVYDYEGGPVSPELSSALASAPAGNVRVRLVWSNGQTSDTEIGAGTVLAWKSIF